MSILPNPEEYTQMPEDEAHLEALRNAAAKKAGKKRKEPVMLAKEGPLAAVRESDAWRTPRLVFDHYDAIYGFELDAASRGADALCQKWMGPDHPGIDMRDALAWRREEGCPINGPIWLNPPYSQAGGGLTNWMLLAADWGQFVPVVALVPATPSTSWFEEAMRNAYQIDLFKSRVAFNTPAGKPSKSPRGDVCAFHFLPHTEGPARLRYVDLQLEEGLRIANEETPW